MASHTGLIAKFLEMASAPDGCSTADLHALGYDIRQIVNNMTSLERAGRVLIVGYRQYRRYYTEQKAADRYEHITLPAIKAEVLKARNQAQSLARRVPDALRKPVKVKVEKPKKKAVEGVQIKGYTGQKWGPDEPVIIPKHVKIQVCPSPAEFGPAAKLRSIGC